MAKSSSKFSAILAFILLSAVTAIGYLLMNDLDGPSISFSPELNNRIGPKQEIVLEVQDPAGIKRVEVIVKRGSQRMTVLENSFDEKMNFAQVPFTLESAKLPEGAFILEIKAYDDSFAGFGQGNGSTYEFTLNLDNKAPRIAVKTIPAVKQGGSAAISFEVSEPVQKAGIYVDEKFFQAYEQKENVFVCLFPFAESIELADFMPQIMAQDLAGNITRSNLTVNARSTKFREDDMNVSDNFLNSKKAELASLAPNKTTPLEQYIEANTKLRTKDNAILDSIGEVSLDKPQWKGEFKVLPRSAVMASFGDRRTYIHNNKVIDQQVHQGIDFASVKQADVPASNNGKVVFVDFLGIYGNLVVIDHGVGLFTIYSHLTDMFVTVGQMVKTGDIVGTTGVSGLAGGDHVHFGVLIGGVAVEPREWLDPKWVRNNINSRLTSVQ